MEKTSRRSFLRSTLSTGAVLATAGATGIALTQPGCSGMPLMINPRKYKTNSFDGIKASSFGDKDVDAEITVLNLTGRDPFYLVQIRDDEVFQFVDYFGKPKTAARAELLPFAAIPEEDVIEKIDPSARCERGKVEIYSEKDVTCFVQSQYVAGKPITSVRTDRPFTRAKLDKGLVTKVSESKFEMPSVDIDGQAASLAYVFIKREGGQKELALIGNPQYLLGHNSKYIDIKGNVFMGRQGKLVSRTAGTQQTTQTRKIIPAVPTATEIFYNH